MARDLFSKTPDLSDRAGYYLLVGLIGFILLFLDQRTLLFYDLRASLNELSTSIFMLSDETRKKIRSQYLTLQEQSELVELIEQQEKINAALQTRVLDREAIEKDNHKLRAQLDLQKRLQTSLLLAEVTSTNYTLTSQTILVSRGAADGVFTGQAVVAENGLVGQVSQVFGTASRILMIADSRHALPVLLQSSDIRMIAEGTGMTGNLVIHNLSNASEISVNETVVTSGLGNTFPYGYPVGRIIDIAIDSTTGLKQVVIKPFADIARVKYVFMVFPAMPKNPQERNLFNPDTVLRVQQ